jgi:TetR/AcrR family transcriptional repressor of nem operon
MGHTQEEKAASRERIVAATARRIREDGLQRPAIAEIMREAGLTHGGFYKHFASRDELIAEAVGRAMTDTERGLEETAAGSADPLAAIAGTYLSPAHRDHPAQGCALPALGEEVRQAPEPARAAYRAQVDRYLDALRAVDDHDDPAVADRAVVTLSAMVGALVLSRALGDTGDSDALLSTVRDAVCDRRILPGSPPGTTTAEEDPA